jgi:hypothetical protein
VLIPHRQLINSDKENQLANSLTSSVRKNTYAAPGSASGPGHPVKYYSDCLIAGAAAGSLQCPSGRYCNAQELDQPSSISSNRARPSCIVFFPAGLWPRLFTLKMEESRTPSSKIGFPLGQRPAAANPARPSSLMQKKHHAEISHRPRRGFHSQRSFGD